MLCMCVDQGGGRTALACSRVIRGRGGTGAAMTGAGTGAGAGAAASGSVRIVTCELSAAEMSNTEGVSGEAERCRVVVLVVDVDEGGDWTRGVSMLEVRRWSLLGRKHTRHTSPWSSARRWASLAMSSSRHGLLAAGSPRSVSSTRDAADARARLGDRRLLDSASRSGVREGDTREGEGWRGATGLLYLTGLRADSSLPSCLALGLGEHALGSSAPRTRRLVGDAFMFVVCAAVAGTWQVGKRETMRQIHQRPVAVDAHTPKEKPTWTTGMTDWLQTNNDCRTNDVHQQRNR